jgi:molecular chaperone DnaJ
VKDHPLFQRHGSDVLLEFPVSFGQAALGAKVEVPTLRGPQELRIPAGTQPGEILRLRSAGLPDVEGRVGNELVRIVVEVPRKLTPDQKELLTAFARTEEENVTPLRKSFLERLKDLFKSPS